MIKDLDTTKNYVMDIQFKHEAHRETVIGAHFPTNFIVGTFISFWYDDDNGFELFFIPLTQLEYFTIHEE